MGRRKTGLTQKEWEAVLKHPHRILYFLAFMIPGYAYIFTITSRSPTLFIIGLIIGAICLVLGIVCTIKLNLSSNESTAERLKQPLVNHRITQHTEANPAYTFSFNAHKFDILDEKLTDSNILEILKIARNESHCSLVETGNNGHKYSYKLDSAYTNEDRRIVKVFFERQEEYRTILRYEQRNYVKYPVYSDEKYKYITIEETFKYTDVAFETLPENDSKLLSRFASDIILMLNSPKLVPSWFLKKCISNWQARTQREYEYAVLQENRYFDGKIKNNNSALEKESAILKELLGNLDDLKTRIEKLISAGKQKKTAKIEIKIQELNDSIHTVEDRIKQIKHSNTEIENEHQKNLAKLEKIYNKAKDKLCSLYEDIVPLSFEIKISDNFTPLKEVQKAQRSKIIGCYVIHNTQNDKYYVGQSKDILRRLSQHFKNTVPNNPIFAEDYYTTPDDLREDLFEVKIIPLETKDQLDSTERKLIDKYDARLNGYNGTSGNK